MSVPLNLLTPVAKMPLVKTITPDMVKPYPLVARFNSETHYVEPGLEGLQTMLGHFKAAAQRGAAIHKGPLKEPLINERRRGRADRTGATGFVCIDVDGWTPDYTPSKPMTRDDLTEMAEEVVQHLPEPLRSTSYVVNASSSTGIKRSGEIGLHIFFLLERGVSPRALENYLHSLNFEADEIEAQLKLQPSNIAIKWIIDPVVARNTQIIYIAPPVFEGREDPFASHDDRWALVKKHHHTCDIAEQVNAVNATAYAELSKQALNKLRQSLGLKKFTPKYRTLQLGSERQRVLTNPDPLNLEYVSHNEHFVYWNVNGGDSNAYYNPIGNPEVIFNFKGEPPFEMKKASPETYEWYCEHFKHEIRSVTESRPLVFRDIATDTHYAVEYIPAHEEIVRCDKIASQNIEDWMAAFGQTPPDPVPQWTMTFDPQSTTTLDWENRVLNLFQPTELIKAPPTLMPQNTGVKLGEARTVMETLCPTIFKVIHHICGNDDEDFEWFMNWFAWCVQHREKSHTAWVFSGVPGTGKGVFYERILRPIIGDSYTHRKRIDHLEENFNAYMQTALFLTYEEFRLRDSASADKLLNKLKDDITADRVNVRAMRTDVVEQRSYTNYIFFSNHRDVIPIEDGDRRFHIATPQMTKLNVAHPDIGEELELIDNEIGTFVGFLMAYDASEKLARTCRDNAAKQAMKQTAMGYGQRFCLALKQGELPYFLDLLDYDTTIDVQNAVRLDTAQKYVKSWAEDAINGRTSRVPMSALLTCYEMLTNNKMTPTLFTRFLNRNDVESKRARAGGKLQRVVDIPWDFSEDDRDFIHALVYPDDHRPDQAVHH